MRHMVIADSVQERGYPVLFRQGDLDGACVLYSLMMCLNLCGFVDEEASFADEPDRRTRLGKLYKQFASFPALFSGGCHIGELQGITTKAYGRRISTEYCEGQNTKILKFTIQHLLAGHPVILGATVKGTLGHALTASGLEFEHSEDAGETPDWSGTMPHKILMLDPEGCEVPPFMQWNSFVFCERSSHRSFPYEFVGGDCEIRNLGFEEALAIWRD